jgi:hypothetical protein
MSTLDIQRTIAPLSRLVITLMLAGCRGAGGTADQASYIAEAGVELARLQFRDICADSARLERLVNASRDQSIPVPGLVTPTNSALGHPLSGTLKSVMVRVNVTASGPVFTIEATGVSQSVERTVSATLTCSETQPSVRPSARVD